MNVALISVLCATILVLGTNLIAINCDTNPDLPPCDCPETPITIRCDFVCNPNLTIPNEPADLPPCFCPDSQFDHCLFRCDPNKPIPTDPNSPPAEGTSDDD